MTDIHVDQPTAAVLSGIAEWHRVVAESDWDRLPDLLAADVVFRDPAHLATHHGKGAMTAILRTVFAIMKDFAYHRHFARADGYVLEFTAQVEGQEVVGVDVIEFDDEGRIADFMVIMRPAAGVLALSAEAGRRLGA